MIMRWFLVISCFLWGLMACGQKGDLYMPAEQGEPQTTSPDQLDQVKKVKKVEKKQ